MSVHSCGEWCDNLELHDFLKQHEETFPRTWDDVIETLYQIVTPGEKLLHFAIQKKLEQNNDS